MKTLIILTVLLGACAPKQSAVKGYRKCVESGACKTTPPDLPDPYPTELKPHIDSFMADAKNQGITPVYTETIEFQTGVLENNENVLGVCYRTGDKRWIRISAYWWAKMTEVYQRQLVYHELGHCGLSRPHSDVLFEVNGQYLASIMATYVTFGDDEFVTENWPSLVEELFHPEKYAQAKLHDETLVDDCFVTPEGYEACPITYGKAFR